MPRYNIYGDVLTAFHVQIEHENFEALSDDEKVDLVAAELGLRRYKRDEDVRIDSVEPED